MRMKIVSLMVGAAIFVTNPLFAMQNDFEDNTNREGVTKRKTEQHSSGDTNNLFQNFNKDYVITAARARTYLTIPAPKPNILSLNADLFQESGRNYFISYYGTKVGGLTAKGANGQYLIGDEELITFEAKCKKSGLITHDQLPSVCFIPQPLSMRKEVSSHDLMTDEWVQTEFPGYPFNPMEHLRKVTPVTRGFAYLDMHYAIYPASDESDE